MKFEEYPLIVPNFKDIENDLNGFMEKLKKAKNSAQFARIMRQVNEYADHIETIMTTIATRYSIDTTNEEYIKAQDALDEMGPQISALFDKYNRLLVSTPFRSELEKIFGSLVFKMTEQNLKCFDEKIIEDLQNENRLTSKYMKIIASAKIKFAGGVYNTSQMGKFLSDSNRDVRRKAAHALYKFYEQNEKEIGEVYDELVHVRDAMAKKLGYKNYIDFGYARLGRLDYDSEMVKTYRDQIVKDVVPLCKKIIKRQGKRIGISNPRFYDLSYNFKTGNPKPVGDTKYLVEKAQEMYSDMSEETGEFFAFMVENHLLELDAKQGKSSGGYMTYFPDYKAPFIFANSNGTSDDVDTLTHEVGHAFQGYCSRNIKIPEYRSPTLEACEIHSMSMEFFAWPYMDKFFGDLSEKYRFSHLSNAIVFLPYGACVDEFQHYVYENPNVTHEQRCAKWAELEKKYTPYKNYFGFSFLQKGTFWMRQSHIFSTAFYYIDYTLAQVVAFQFLVEMQKDHEKAWKKYVKLCKLGGKYTFTELLSKAKLRNPFVDGSIKKVIRPLKKILNSFDDMNM